jgi:60S ribosome subunit biogenesis protein NIP7
MKQSLNVNRDNLLSVGVCFGKFTKTRKFRLQITCLDYLAKYAVVNIIIFTMNTIAKFFLVQALD